MQVYEKSLSTVQVVDGQLVRKVKVVKVWLEANLFSQKWLGRQLCPFSSLNGAQQFRKFEILTYKYQSQGMC